MEVVGGVLSGSGLYGFPLEDKKVITVETPFENVSLTIGKYNGKLLAFLPRHGKEHTLPPSEIPYRTNIFALFKLGVEWILTTSTVGSLRKQYKVGSFVVLDQVMDFTKHRKSTFFDGHFAVELENGELKEGVVHTEMTNPYSETLRKNILKAAEDIDATVHPQGTYICTEGPRFETASEIAFFSQFGDVIGMTQVPEVFLANELDLNYATIAIVTNYAAGMQAKVTHEEVEHVMDKKRSTLIEILQNVLQIL